MSARFQTCKMLFLWVDQSFPFQSPSCLSETKQTNLRTTELPSASLPLSATPFSNANSSLLVSVCHLTGVQRCANLPLRESHSGISLRRQLTGWHGAWGLGKVPQKWAGSVCRDSSNASSTRREKVDKVEGHKGISSRGKTGEITRSDVIAHSQKHCSALPIL